MSKASYNVLVKNIVDEYTLRDDVDDYYFLVFPAPPKGIFDFDGELNYNCC